MTKKQRDIAKKTLCEWLSQTSDMDLFQDVKPAKIAKEMEFVFAITLKEREFAVFRFSRGIWLNEAALLGVSGGFMGDDNENCAVVRGCVEFPKGHKESEKLARNMAEHILKG